MINEAGLAASMAQIQHNFEIAQQNRDFFCERIAELQEQVSELRAAIDELRGRFAVAEQKNA